MVTFPPCTCNHTTTHAQAFTTCTISNIAPLWTWRQAGNLRLLPHPASTKKTAHSWIPQVHPEVRLAVCTRPSLWMFSPRCGRRHGWRGRPWRRMAAPRGWTRQAASTASPACPRAASHPRVWKTRCRIRATSLASERAAPLFPASHTAAAPVQTQTTLGSARRPQPLPGCHPDPKLRRSWPAAPPWPARQPWPPRPGFRSSLQSPSTSARERLCDTRTKLLIRLSCSLHFNLLYIPPKIFHLFNLTDLSMHLSVKCLEQHRVFSDECTLKYIKQCLDSLTKQNTAS